MRVRTPFDPRIAERPCPKDSHFWRLVGLRTHHLGLGCDFCGAEVVIEDRDIDLLGREASAAISEA